MIMTQNSPNYNTLNFVTKRLAQLSISNINPQTSYNLFKYHLNGCNLWENWHLESNGHRDQAVLKCDPITLAGVQIPLGAVWGHVDTTITKIPASSTANATLLSVNAKTMTPTIKQVLWSGSNIVDSDSSCTLCGEISSDSCFDYNGDSLGVVLEALYLTA